MMPFDLVIATYPSSRPLIDMAADIRPGLLASDGQLVLAGLLQTRLTMSSQPMVPMV